MFFVKLHQLEFTGIRETTEIEKNNTLLALIKMLKRYEYILRNRENSKRNISVVTG